MQQKFDLLKAFDFAGSDVYLWVFKRSATPEKFTARYAQTDESLNNVLRTVAQAEMARLTEFSDYTYLAETNENSCLATQIDGSDFTHLKAVVDRPEPDYRVRNTKDLRNASGYVVKFTRDGHTIYAVKRSAPTWKTAYFKTHINIVFSNGELSAVEDNGFAIEKTFDFYVAGTAIFIASKRAFESVMEHRASYAQAFRALQASPTFSGLFTNIQPLAAYVGTNSIQLRRMARIEERALYTRPGFLSKLRSVSVARGWNLNFEDVTDRIVPCEQTVRTIMQVLLDHRLLSEVTETIYDVPDVTPI